VSPGYTRTNWYLRRAGSTYLNIKIDFEATCEKVACFAVSV
jgi:hypothetical protein